MASRYWVSPISDTWNNTAGLKWSATSGGVGGQAVPTSSDDVFFDSGSGTNTVTVNNSQPTANSIDFTGYTGTFSNQSGEVHLSGTGGLKMVAGMTYSTDGFDQYDIAGSGTQNITFGGKTIAFLVFSGTGTTAFQDAASFGALILQNGTVDFNGQTVAITGAGIDASTIVSAATLTFGSSVITFSGSTSGIILDVSGGVNLTFNTNTSQIIDTGSGTRTYNLGGKTHNNIKFKGNATYRMTGASTPTITTLTLDSSVQGFTFRITAGMTITTTTFSATGSSGKVITINCITAASQGHFSKSSGTVNCDYLSLKDNDATGGATWNAGANSTQISNVTGWNFPVTVNSNMFLVF